MFRIEYKKYLLSTMLAVSIIVSCGNSYAQNTDTLLQQYLFTAVENNPAVQAKFLDYYAALEKIPQVGGLPDPTATLGYYILPVETRVGQGIANVQLSQSFPWFGTLKAKKDEASKLAAAAFQVFQSAKNDLFYELKEKYYQLYFVQKSILFRQEYLEILELDEKVALARVSGGNANLSDVLRIQMNNKENETQLTILEDKFQTLSAELNKLLNQPMNKLITVADSVPPIMVLLNEKELLDSSMQNNPELNQLRQLDLAYKVKEVVAKKSGLPNFGVGLSYSAIKARQTEMEVPRNGQDIVMPMISLSIPIYRAKYKAMQKEAVLQKQSNQLQLKDLQNSLSATMTKAINQYKDAGHKIELYQQLIEQAEQIHLMLNTSYSSGKEPYVEVLRIEEKILDYRLNLQEAIAEQHTALALLHKLTADEL